MNSCRRIIAAFIIVWGMLADFTFPRAVIAPFKMQVPTTTVLFCFPLTGALAGLLTCCFGLLISVIFNTFSGALVFTLAAGGLFFFKDSGRGLALLISYISGRIGGKSEIAALENCTSTLNEVLRNPIVMLLTGVFVIIVLGMLFALFYWGASLWFAAVMAADALVQARLCLENDRNTKMPFIRTLAGGGRYLALSGGLLALLAVIFFPRIAALGAIVILWVWFWRELPSAEEFRNGLSSGWISMYGFWAGVLTLLCGMGLL